MKLHGAARLQPGAYHLTDPEHGILQVTGSDFVIDCSGARIIGPGTGLGIGIHVTDARNVTIRNADVSGCLWGIVVERSAGVKLVNCRTSYNHDLKPGTVIDESGREPEDQWGGGVLLRDCRTCGADRCSSQYQWDGIDVVRCEGCVIQNGDYSYNGNWGVHLWDSSHNTFRRNRAIWCTTGAGKLYQALTGWQTYDAQAVGIDHNSCDNVIEGNDLRFGGDAIFIRANEGPITPGTVVPPRNGSHRNILRDNDCSYSPNNAIEVDLVDDTVIENNNCSNSHYGMWLGYSRRCVVRGNTCVNDSAHAVEIENGQEDLFERNVFGYDDRRPNSQLILLRQNGRDKTPSQGYRFVNNLFYGAGTGVRLTNTSATLTNNTLVPIADATMLAGADSRSAAAETGTQRGAPDSTSRPAFSLPAKRPIALVPNSNVQLSVPGSDPDRPPPVIEIDGIPAWVRKIERDSVTFTMPGDFWDRPGPAAASLRAIVGGMESRPLSLAIHWPQNARRMEKIAPNPARIGDTITVTGVNLAGGRLLLNGKPVEAERSGAASMTFRLPPGILVPTRYNLLWERGERENRVHTWPITLGVDVPAAQMPHLVAAFFEPTTLKVGDLLKVTMTVRNNLPAPALLSRRPDPPFTYRETQASYEMGLAEQEGKLHLRVTSDRTAPHDPGSWPYLFGFDRDALAPGESVTVVGFIKMEHVGVHEFRIGLVAGGFRFIDDNAFRTQVTVTP
jgi:parallel beta-helix repeat protein